MDGSTFFVPPANLRDERGLVEWEVNGLKADGHVESRGDSDDCVEVLSPHTALATGDAGERGGVAFLVLEKGEKSGSGDAGGFDGK
eukprot:CAMPEP_0175856220 /NCGR_PEP_ID=MMETSP0107_2-20121207/28372_1 /TAXON_ID=195067 ORGANISM="Goniomonas pacifica, Strain CCMP1869" /NCGR_SAMPLE_ID=MMETSP0107_2 /ASSEMBLY_ACC=CAM_ASM_000203 /LENGTH=85 /DNA_ID=CAMNT_0017172291 /DNA_START=56 /DNA_END=313 /DNA_ORIENTATION=-